MMQKSTVQIPLEPIFRLLFKIMNNFILYQEELNAMALYAEVSFRMRSFSWNESLKFPFALLWYNKSVTKLIL